MARVVLAFFFLLLWATGSISAQMATVRYTVVLPEGKRLPLYAQRLHDRDYVPFSELATTFFRGGVVEKDGSGVLWKSELIRSMSSSFYLSRNSANGVRIAQMPYPTLSIGQKIYVPLLPLCSAVETLGLFAVEIQGNTIVLHKLSEHSPAAVLLPSYAVSEKVESRNTRTTEIHEGIEGDNSSPKDIMTGGDLPEEEMEVAEEPVSVIEPRNIGKALAPFKRSAASVGSSTPARQSVAPVAVPQQVKPDTVQRTLQRSANKKEELQPNRYILPRGLYRRELMDERETQEDSLRSFLHDTGSSLQAGPPLAFLAEASASLSSFAEPTASALPDGAVSIVAMEATVGRETVQIEVKGNTAINQYQRPEWNGKQVVLRFPAARNTVGGSTLQRLGATAPLSSVRSEQRGDILVYTLAFTGDITGCTYTRKSATTLLFTITTPTGSSGSSVGTVAREEAKRWALDVIVLDAGHGGKDVGAISISGKHEKDITLALVKKLGALIEQQMPSTKVVYTRTDDRFVELYRRGQIANEAGGKLFISIHCNSMPTKPHPAHGCETYILRPGRNEDAVRVAERENSAIKFESNQKRYKKLTDEQFIVVNMAQSAFVKFSEKFGSVVQQEVSTETPLANRGVNQAGFYVLVGASMPNILFEAAFLSNTDDEQFITSAKGQDDLVRGLFNAIRLYAEQYEQMIKTQK